MREFASLVQGPSPAVLTTYRKDATAAASPGLVPIPRPHLRGRDRRKRREARPPSRPPGVRTLGLRSGAPVPRYPRPIRPAGPDPGRSAAGPPRYRCTLPRRRAPEEIRGRTHQHRRLVAPPGGSRYGLGPGTWDLGPGTSRESSRPNNACQAVRCTSVRTLRRISRSSSSSTESMSNSGCDGGRAVLRHWVSSRGLVYSKAVTTRLGRPPDRWDQTMLVSRRGSCRAREAIERERADVVAGFLAVVEVAHDLPGR
jgi:hypothetical protein